MADGDEASSRLKSTFNFDIDESMKLFACLGFGVALLSIGCGDDGGDATTDRVVATYAQHVQTSYANTLTSAKAMKTSIDAFLANPSSASLDAARAAWKAAREPYLLTEVFRFYDGPIDNPEDGPEGRINSWPLDEVFIDYVEGNPNGGIINNPGAFPAITMQVIEEQNEKGGEANISAGYHAIEFLLWGQDLSPTGPGNRPHTDYQTGGSAMNQDRRRTYLQLVTNLLVDDLQHVTDAWAEGADYRVEFEAGGKASIQKILLGMGSLSGAELSGERMTVAMNNRDQEDEHSCFSDNTHRDLLGNIVGIQKVDDLLDELLRAKDPALADKLKSDIAASVAAIQTIPAPFDQTITSDPGRAKVTAGIQALQALTATTVDAATALGIAINLK